MAQHNYLDKDGLLYFWSKVKALANTKVDKVEGKGLSTNDYTTEEKTKLAGIEAGAQVNVLEGIMVNGTTQTITAKTVNIAVPTKVTDLANDAGYLTQHQSLEEYAKKTELPKNVSELANDAGYLTAVPEEYVTETELAAKGYLTEHQSLAEYAKKSEIPTNVSAFTNDAGYLTEVPAEFITEEELAAKGYLTQHQSLEEYAKKAELPTKVSELENDKGYLTEVPAEFITETELEAKGYLTQHQSLEEYAKKTELPTAVSQLTNDVKYQTEDEVTGLIADAVGKITGIDFQVVDALPASGVKGVIYLLPISGNELNNIHEEYIWVNSKWEKIGTTACDLSGYVKTADLVAITNAEIDAITA